MKRSSYRTIILIIVSTALAVTLSLYLVNSHKLADQATKSTTSSGMSDSSSVVTIETQHNDTASPQVEKPDIPSPTQTKVTQSDAKDSSQNSQTSSTPTPKINCEQIDGKYKTIFQNNYQQYLNDYNTSMANQWWIGPNNYGDIFDKKVQTAWETYFYTVKDAGCTPSIAINDVEYIQN